MPSFRDPETAKRPADPAKRAEVLRELDEFRALGPAAATGVANMLADYQKEFGLADEPLEQTITTEQRVIWLHGATSLLYHLWERAQEQRAAL